MARVGSDTEIYNIYREVTGRELPGGAEGTAILEEMRNYSADEVRNKLRGGWSPSQGNIDRLTDEQLSNEIISYINELEEYMQQFPLDFTQAEMDNFLQRAIEEVTPYYEKKKAEIEAGIREGRLRGAEDVLMEIRAVKDDLATELKELDIRQAQTEEEFVNTLADITASKDEDLETKKYEWQQRVDAVKTGQVQSGTLTSGVGKKYVQELLGREQAEKAAVERKAEQEALEAETAKKYDLQAISLAREAAEKERVRRLGTAEQEEATTGAALSTLGLTGLEQLPSETEIARRRGEYTGRLYSSEDLSDWEEERKRMIEAQRQEFETQGREELYQTAEKARQKKISELAQKYKSVAPSVLQSYLY